MLTTIATLAVQGTVVDINFDRNRAKVRNIAEVETIVTLTEPLYIEVLCRRRRRRRMCRTMDIVDEKGNGEITKTQKKKVVVEEEGSMRVSSVRHRRRRRTERERAWDEVRVGQTVSVFLGSFEYPGRVVALDRTPGVSYVTLLDETGLTYIPLDNVLLLRIVRLCTREKKKEREKKTLTTHE